MMTEPTPVPGDVLSALRRHQRVLIAAHAHPDADAMGSCLAMAWVLRSTGVDALVFNEDGLPDFLKFLTLPGPVLTDPDSLPCDPDLVVCLDCGDRARLGETLQPLLNRVPTLNIDHHLANPLFGTEADRQSLAGAPPRRACRSAVCGRLLGYGQLQLRQYHRRRPASCGRHGGRRPQHRQTAGGSGKQLE